MAAISFVIPVKDESENIKTTLCTVKNVIPGQKVSFRVKKVRKSRGEGNVNEILEKATNEIESSCPHFGMCGGCTYLNLSYEDQIKLKETKKRFEHFSQTELIIFTYKKYPYYAINSTIAQDLLTETELEIVKQQKVNKSEQQLFSIGYEGISLESYINKSIGVFIIAFVLLLKSSFIFET